MPMGKYTEGKKCTYDRTKFSEDVEGKKVTVFCNRIVDVALQRYERCFHMQQTTKNHERMPVFCQIL